MQAGPAPFEWLWQDSMFADVVLEIVATPEDETQPYERRELLLHAAVLGTCALYFRPRLVAWRDESPLNRPLGTSVGPPLSECLHIREHCARDMFPAAVALIQVMYTQQVPSDPALLVKMCRQADYWNMVPPCMDSCLHALGCVFSDQQSLLHWHLLDQLPPHVLASSAAQLLVSSLGKQLYMKLGSTVDILTAPSKLQWFLSLPFSVISTVWADMDGMLCDGEDGVAVLCTLWCHHCQQQHGDQALSADQLQELSSRLRLPQLSKAFYTHVLPMLTWFRPGPAGLPLWEDLILKHPGHKHTVGETADPGGGDDSGEDGGRERAAQPAAGKHQGLISPVKSLRPQLQSLQMQWVVDRAELRAAWSGPGSHATPAANCYWCGYTWEAVLEFKPAADGPGMTLGLFLWVKHCKQLCEVVQGLAERVPAVSVTASLSVAGVKVMKEQLQLAGLGVGWADMLDVRIQDLDRDLLVPHLVEGRLHCKVVLERPC